MTHFSKYSIKLTPSGIYAVGIFTGINSNQPQPFDKCTIMAQLQHDYPKAVVNSHTITERYPEGCTRDTPSSIEITVPRARSGYNPVGGGA